MIHFEKEKCFLIIQRFDLSASKFTSGFQKSRYKVGIGIILAGWKATQTQQKLTKTHWNLHFQYQQKELTVEWLFVFLFKHEFKPQIS